MNTLPSKKNSCSYCGDAPIIHSLAFIESVMVIAIDAHAKKLIKLVPSLIKSSIDLVPSLLLEIMVFFRAAKFSADPDTACSVRSKIIWREAQKRGIIMEQVILLGKPLDHYRAIINGRKMYFESIPIQPKFLEMSQNWDDKLILKKEFSKKNIPVPAYFNLPFLNFHNLEKIFSTLQKPIIIKPRIGSRGRHTITDIKSLSQFRSGIKLARQICSHLIIEEHLIGSVCRATLVGGALIGFYQAEAFTVMGDGLKTIRDLIKEKNNKRHSRVEAINVSREVQDQIARSGFTVDQVLPDGFILPLSHRMGRLFGGATKEMLNELHPSFIPILEQAARVVGLAVVGFDAIIPDPTQPANSQKWGIIECNSLPFIDLHYYALAGQPKNIAGAIWDLWDHP